LRRKSSKSERRLGRDMGLRVPENSLRPAEGDKRIGAAETRRRCSSQEHCFASAETNGGEFAFCRLQ